MSTDTRQPSAAADSPRDLLGQRRYVGALVAGALLGVPVAIVAYLFLAGVDQTQQYVFTQLPTDVGLSPAPVWWPLPVLGLSGLLVGLAIRHLPGTGGHEPSEGFKPAGPVRPNELPGIIIAAAATLGLGGVLGPEGPLVAIGSGLGVLAIRLRKRDAPAQAVMVVAAAASFAAISTLLGSPLAAAFLLMEASGLGGPLLGVVLVPGLLAAGIGSLIFVGLDNLTGLGVFSLAIPDVPSFASPTVAEFAWAIAIGLAAAVLGGAVRRLSLALQPRLARHRVTLTPVAGLLIGAIAAVFAIVSGRSTSDVLFSGQSALPSLIEQAGDWTAGALVLLIVCKGLAYVISLSGFRGGPTFPAMFIGAAGGIALAELPGLPMIAGVAMGIGAMTTVMLGLPLTAVLLTALFLPSDAVALTPLIIVAVVVAYVADARITPTTGRDTHPVPVSGGASPAAR